MGRLYDRRDLAFNLEFWARHETQLSADIANARIPASFLDHVLQYPMGCNCFHGPCGKQHYKYIKVRDSFELEIKRERMKLLRTGQLLSDLKAAQRNFDSCDHCHYEKRGQRTVARECDVHNPALKKAKAAVYWAGERNLQERNARGQIRTDGVAPAQEKLEGLPEVADAVNPLNQWEQMYQRAKAEGVWPLEAKLYDTTPDYRGYLWVLRFEEEMTEAEYLTELEHLRQVGLEREQSGLAWAGFTTKQGTRKSKVTFRRDTRYNLVV